MVATIASNPITHISYGRPRAPRKAETRMLTFVALQVTGEEGIILGRLRKWFNELGGDEALMEEEEEERPAMAEDREAPRVVL